MANFTPKTVVKSAVRTLTAPITDLTAFSEVVDDILTNNPFDCTAYESGGVAMPAVEKSREWYTARFAYENSEAVTIATTTVKCPTVAAYNGVVTAVPAATAINTAIGRTGVHIEEDDSFSATVKCHDANGELYNVAISRSAVTVWGTRPTRSSRPSRPGPTPCPRWPERPRPLISSEGRSRPSGPGAPCRSVSDCCPGAPRPRSFCHSRSSSASRSAIRIRGCSLISFRTAAASRIVAFWCSSCWSLPLS